MNEKMVTVETVDGNRKVSISISTDDYNLTPATAVTEHNVVE